jgi:hypothetical protein
MKLLRSLTWLMVLLTSVLSVVTMIVTFGMVEYSSKLKPFSNFMLLEIFLSITLFLWALDNLYRDNTTRSKIAFGYYIVLSGIFLVFIFNNVY